MRAPSIIAFVTLLLLAALAALNLEELMRPTGLNLGWQRLSDTPLSLVMLGVAVLGLLLMLLAGVLAQRKQQNDMRQLQGELLAQRQLADKAEGSRLLEVQRHLDLQAQAAQHREREMLDQLNDHLEQVRRALERQMDEVGNSLAAYIGEVEDRLERRQVLHPDPEGYRDRPAHRG